MIKRFCDRCGSTIVGRDFRKLLITDSDDNYVCVMGNPIWETLPTVELCKECAAEVIEFIKNK